MKFNEIIKEENLCASIQNEYSLMCRLFDMILMSYQLMKYSTISYSPLNRAS